MHDLPFSHNPNPYPFQQDRETTFFKPSSSNFSDTDAGGIQQAKDTSMCQQNYNCTPRTVIAYEGCTTCTRGHGELCRDQVSEPELVRDNDICPQEQNCGES